MRILYVSQWLSEIGGGGEIVFRDLAYGMVKFGHRVDVISQYHTDIHDINLGNDLCIHRVKPILQGPPPPTPRQNAAYVLNGILKGSQIIRSRKIELIHANNLTSAIIGAVLSKIFSVPLIITVHILFTNSKDNFWKEWASQPNVSRVTSLIAPFVERLITRVHADAIHTVTNSTKIDLLNSGTKSDIVVIHNGINLAGYDKLNFRVEYQDYVLFIGRLVFNKNLGFLITFFSEVVKCLPHATLVVIGDGPMRQQWEQLVSQLNLESNIRFTGFLPHENKMELLSKCSALLMPSYMEGLTLTVLEAFAMHKPVIVPEFRASYEAVDEGIDGFIVPLDKPMEWAEKVIMLLSDKPTARRMGEHARTKVEKKFNQVRVLEEINLLYEQIQKKYEQMSYHDQDSK
jgi:glycosyltransferase involved in cell wall biosynthesis